MTDRTYPGGPLSCPRAALEIGFGVGKPKARGLRLQEHLREVESKIGVKLLHPTKSGKQSRVLICELQTHCPELFRSDAARMSNQLLDLEERLREDFGRQLANLVRRINLLENVKIRSPGSALVRGHDGSAYASH